MINLMPFFKRHIREPALKRQPTLYLHGGAGKTGTSFLQIQFARHSEELMKSGVVYPKGHMFEEATAGKITSGNGVELANYFRPHLPHNIENKGAYLRQLSQILNRSDGADVLLSSEFLTLTNNEAAQRFLETVEQCGYDIRYIFFVRDFDRAAVSFYSQHLKRGGDVRRFEEFIDNWKPGYSSAIEPARKLLGRDRTAVYNYEEHKEHLGAFFFGEILKTAVVPEETSQVNRSLTPIEAELQRLVNVAASGDSTVATFISDAVVRMPCEAKPFLLTAEEGRRMAQRLSTELQYINKLVIGQPLVFFREVVEKRETIAISDFERFTIATLVKLAQNALRR